MLHSGGPSFSALLEHKQVTSHDEDISKLTELAHTENLRVEHASRMLAKYVKRAAADVAAGVSDGNGARLSGPGPGSRGATSRYSSRRAPTSRAR